MYHAWYSESSEKEFGSMNYQKSNGEFVIVTVVSKDINYQHTRDDVVYVGEVEKMISINSPTKIKTNWVIEGNDILNN